MKASGSLFREYVIKPYHIGEATDMVFYISSLNLLIRAFLIPNERKVR